MNRAELLALIESLNPDNTQIAGALGFIRLVVENNPNKTAAQIEKRPDVQQALQVIQDWVDQAESVVTEVVNALPVGQGAAARDLGKTLDTFEFDVDVSDSNLEKWRLGEESREVWTARMLLRMNWFVDWLRGVAGNLLIGSPYKRWVSRLAPNTCKYCAGLHGVVLPMGKSFLAEAKKLGFKRPYGGLYGPPLHPRCQCWLVPVTQAEVDALSEGGTT